MHRNDFLPAGIQDFAAFCKSFSATISSDPLSFGISLEQASTLADLYTRFAAAMKTAFEPSTRTAPAIVARDVARDKLEKYVRTLARIIQGTPGMDNVRRRQLGLSQRRTSTDGAPARSAIKAVESRPILYVERQDNAGIFLRLSNETQTTRRALPFGAVSAVIFSFAGSGDEAPPADLEAWRFEKLATRSETIVPLRLSDFGKRLYFCARWANPRGELSPVSDSAAVMIYPTYLCAA